MSDGFNPVLGFLPVVTAERAPDERDPHHCFNPVLGFLPVVTPCRETTSVGKSPFQSRLGFSPRRDSRQFGDAAGRLWVSIPSWVFSPS